MNAGYRNRQKGIFGPFWRLMKAKWCAWWVLWLGKRSVFLIPRRSQRPASCFPLYLLNFVPKQRGLTSSRDKLLENICTTIAICVWRRMSTENILLVASFSLNYLVMRLVRFLRLCRLTILVQERFSWAFVAILLPEFFYYTNLFLFLRIPPLSWSSSSWIRCPYKWDESSCALSHFWLGPVICISVSGEDVSGIRIHLGVLLGCTHVIRPPGFQKGKDVSHRGLITFWICLGRISEQTTPCFFNVSPYMMRCFLRFP